jgi:hypothetical protein
VEGEEEEHFAGLACVMNEIRINIISFFSFTIYLFVYLFIYFKEI